ncbi:DUF5133 domain-containing protein [Streptomyces sp. NPDC048349]|uniref:DUF5133 domain-containing protein n=1 Tax=Streptomyces sp. NPDC048349 TaxID=3155486 RepID=UPI003445FDCB
MTASVPLARGPAPAPLPETPAPPQAVSWAVGTLMARIPAPARVAERILSTAAAQARVPVTALATAMAAQARGTPLPAGAERALRQAVQAAQSPDSAPAPPEPHLLPSLDDAEQALGRFFDARLRLAAAPTDGAARQALEDSLFTLCVLMAQPSAHVAVHDALQYTQG